jgi:hypothetical protein
MSSIHYLRVSPTFTALDKANPDIGNTGDKLGGGQAYNRSSEQTAAVAGATNDRA